MESLTMNEDLPFVSRARGAQKPNTDFGNRACLRRSASPIKRPFTSFGVKPVVASSPRREKMSIKLEIGIKVKDQRGVKIPRN